MGREGWRILIDELGGGTTVAAAGQLVVVEGVESVEVRWGAEGGKGVTGKLEKKGWGGGTTRKEGSRVPICDLCNANRLREHNNTTPACRLPFYLRMHSVGLASLDLSKFLVSFAYQLQ